MERQSRIGDSSPGVRLDTPEAKQAFQESIEATAKRLEETRALKTENPEAFEAMIKQAETASDQ